MDEKKRIRGLLEEEEQMPFAWQFSEAAAGPLAAAFLAGVIAGFLIALLIFKT